MGESSKYEAAFLDVVFDVLADQRRRSVLRCLNRHKNPMALADVADEVATRETEVPITELSAQEVKRVYVSLYHKQIPKLVDAAVVRYNQDTDMVMLAEDTEAWNVSKDLLAVI